MASLLDLSNRRELADLAQLVAAIRLASPTRELLLVGATARDIHLWYQHKIVIERATFDMDFAIAVGDWPEYLDLRQQLIDSGAFSDEQGTLHRLILKPAIKLDLIPFGGVEREDRTIAWPPNQDEVMSLIGYREAMLDSVPVLLPDNQKINVVTLPALALLKLFAWQDRRRRSPGKDAQDLASVLYHYLEAGNEDRLYTQFTHLFDSPDYDYLAAGAWMLGADMRLLLDDDGEGLAMHAAMKLLEPQVDPDGRLHLATDMGPIKAAQSLKLLSAMLAGLAGRTSPWR